MMFLDIPGVAMPHGPHHATCMKDWLKCKCSPAHAQHFINNICLNCVNVTHFIPKDIGGSKPQITVYQGSGLRTTCLFSRKQLRDGPRELNPCIFL